jgi:putative DNA primase/helicase
MVDQLEPKDDGAQVDPASMTPEQMRAACEARVLVEAADLAAIGAGGNGNGKGDIDYRFLKRCLDCNELGDGILFSRLCTGKFIFNASSQGWLRFNGNNWELDIEGRSLAAVEDVSERYLTMLDTLLAKKKKASDDADGNRVLRIIKVEKKVLKRVSRLRSDRGRHNALRLASSNRELALVAREDDFDLNRWLLPVKNAVIDLRTGEAVQARPEDMLLKACPTEWLGISHPCPTWERFLREIFLANDEMIEFIQRILGYAVTGDVSEHVLPVFVGAGRNGKGTIFEMMHHVLGDLCQPIQAEMLLDSGHARSSSAPSADIMGLKGLRMAFASETGRSRNFSMERVKWLSGGDTLKGRWPNDKFEVTFAATHKLFLGTNDIPKAISDDFAFWQRVKVVRFLLSFVDEPRADNERLRDKSLLNKLKAESSGILAWLVRGCLEWQRIGLKPPESVKHATEEERASGDYLQDWIDECLVMDKYAETKSSKLYFNFVFWYEQTVGKKRTPSQNAWGKMMVRRLKREKHGVYIYYGVACPDLPICENIGPGDKFCGVENLPSAVKCHKCGKNLDNGDSFKP